MWGRVMRQSLEVVGQEPDQWSGAAGSFGDSGLPWAPETW